LAAKSRYKTDANDSETPLHDVPATTPAPSASAYASASVSPEKKEYGELKKVKLTDDEYAKLIAKHGEPTTLAAIEILDGYIGQQKKDPYANHYAVMKEGSWVWERVVQSGKSNASGESPSLKDYKKQIETIPASEREAFMSKCKDALTRQEFAKLCQYKKDNQWRWQ
jgi:hypothetical protein